MSFDETDLPRKGKTELLKRYRTRLDGARQHRESKGYDDTWARLRDLYRLKHFKADSDQDRIAVAISFATINVIAPSVAVNSPKIVVWPTEEDPDHQNKASIAEGVTNYWWRRYKFKRPIKRAVKDSLIFGLGIVKVGWRYEDREVARPEEEIEAEIQQRIEQADQQAMVDIAAAGELPTDDEIAAQVERTTLEVVKDEPFVERVSIFDLYVDPEATMFEDARWVAQKIVRPVEEVRNDDRYKPSVRKKLKADGSVQRRTDDTPDFNTDGDNANQDDILRVTLWEFYDLTRGTISVFPEQGDAFLVDPAPMPYPFGLPFVPLPNYEVPDQFYPLGDLEAIEPLQLELNETRSEMVQARRLDKAKYLFRKDRFGPDGLDALRSNKPWVGVEVEGQEPLSDAIQVLERPAPNAEMYQHSQQIESDIDLVSGVSEYQRGSISEIRRTATEAAIVQDASNARSADKLAQVEEATSEIARRIVQLAQIYMTGDQAARATGNDGAVVTWRFTADDIQGDFDFEVEAGSTQPRNETFRRQQAQQMAATLAPFVGIVVDPAQMVMHILREGYGIKDPSAWLLPAPMGMPAEAPPGAEEELPPEEVDVAATLDDTRAQLAGQVGLDIPTNGGGILGPGGVAR